MSIKPRTIDNLGIEASNKYAKDQEALDLRLIEDFRRPTKLEGGFTPYIPAGGEESFTIFSIGSATVWAAFSSPENFSIQASGLFSHLMLPSIGGSEGLQALKDKLENLEKTIPQNSGEQREYKIVRSFISYLTDASRTFELIRARCNQYQRG